MIDTDALKSKILASAMRGQLSERLPGDSLTETLYHEIVKLKQELVKRSISRKEQELEEDVEPE